MKCSSIDRTHVFTYKFLGRRLRHLTAIGHVSRIPHTHHTGHGTKPEKTITYCSVRDQTKQMPFQWRLLCRSPTVRAPITIKANTNATLASRLAAANAIQLPRWREHNKEIIMLLMFPSETSVRIEIELGIMTGIRRIGRCCVRQPIVAHHASGQSN